MADPNRECNLAGFEWKNSTHRIDNTTCEWQENDDKFLGLDPETVIPIPFGYTPNATREKCINDSMEWVDNPNNPGEKIMNLNSIEKC